MRIGALTRPRKARAGEGTPDGIARDMVRRADAARDSGRFREAAFLYAEALRLWPHRVDLHVQCGHMFKEAGEFAAAEEQYRAAAAAKPNDADLALQLGHFYKTTGRLGEASAAYRRALALQPGWAAAKDELQAFSRAGWSDADEAPPITGELRGEGLAAVLGAGADIWQLAPELAARPIGDVLRAHDQDLAIRRLGLPERTPWGRMNTLRGVTSFRGFCVADQPIVSIEIRINGLMVHRGGLKGGFRLPNEIANPRMRKYVFNAWVDLSGFATGRYEVQYIATDVNNLRRERFEQVVIAPPKPVPELPESDTFVPAADPADPRPLDEQINARPSMVRLARRALLKEPPRNVLVLRPDVLGDLVVAVPALRRLRQLLPESRLVGLVSNANVDLARTLGVFDEMVVTNLTYAPLEQRRVVPIEEQARLAVELAPYKFDLAIDLGTSPDSRLLLPLSGAPVLVGFRADALPGLTVEVTGGTSDPHNGHEIVPHTNMAMGLIEWLGAMMRSELNLVERPELSRAQLAAFGLAPDARYVVLHSGGRWEFSRWPHYLALAQMILAQTDLHVILMTTDPTTADRLPDALAASDRFQVLSRRLEFDDLDALLTFCTVFVGDDSGVKHLASLRGAKVIGIQNARNNWNEWGHDNAGYIVTRRVPCAGCLIQNYPESDECGRDFVCITAIRPEEIMSAVQRLIEG